MKHSTLLSFLLLICTLTIAQNRTVFDDVHFTASPIQNINTVGSDISPFFINDTLYFSAIPEKFFNKTRRERKNKAFYNLYSANLDKNGNLISDRSLVHGFGAEIHEGPAAFCESTGELFVTVSNVVHPDTIHEIISVKEVRLRLIIMKKLDGEWQKVEEFPYNSNQFNFAHPAINKTGDTLVFSSDVDSLTIGKTDLFMSTRTNGKWSFPVNLGEKVNSEGEELFPTFIEDGLLSFASNGRQNCMGGLDIYYTRFNSRNEILTVGNEINSAFDDFGLVIHKNQEFGFFSSNRSGNSSDDIYKLKISKQFNHLAGTVVHDITNVPIENAMVEIFDCDDKIAVTVRSNENGSFNIDAPASRCHTIEASKAGFLPDKLKFEAQDIIELRLKPAQTREILVLDIETQMPISGAGIRNNQELNMLTDIRGIVKLSSPILTESEINITKEGFLNQSVQLKRLPANTEFGRDTVWLYKKENNKSFTLKNIYYDLDKWDILPESEIELNKLVQILKDNSEIKVELGSHTDSRGNDSYNMRLSQKRSESAVDYIVANGIDNSRIVAKGYGESQLINNCKNGVKCTEAEHRRNRRTEFKIISF